MGIFCAFCNLSPTSEVSRLLAGNEDKGMVKHEICKILALIPRK